MAKKTEKWMQEAVDPKKKGDLHKKLNIPQDKKIPTALLKKKKKQLQEKAKGDKKLNKADKEMLGQIQFALNVRKSELVRDLIKAASEFSASGFYAQAAELDKIAFDVQAGAEDGKSDATKVFDELKERCEIIQEILHNREELEEMMAKLLSESPDALGQMRELVHETAPKMLNGTGAVKRIKDEINIGLGDINLGDEPEEVH